MLVLRQEEREVQQCDKGVCGVSVSNSKIDCSYHSDFGYDEGDHFAACTQEEHPLKFT